MDQQVERRKLYNGFGNAMSSSIEFTLGPVIFGGLGWLLDRWLGLAPVLTVALSIVGVVASFVRTWFRYDAEMKVQEAAGTWNKTYSPAPRTEGAGVGSASEQPARERNSFSVQRTEGAVTP